MWRRPAPWILLSLAAVAATAVAYRYFPQAFPIVSLEITMDRGRALSEARALAGRFEIGPRDARQAATFELDDEVQTFVELEGGGKAAFARLIEHGPYAPYTWRVRHFREAEVHEATFSFTPDGRPFGFVERLDEDAPGAALSAAAARQIAEAAAARQWGLDVSSLTFVESAQTTRPGGRVDHQLTYERPERLIEGRLRVRLGVSGDELTQLTQFVRIPEAFTRRYEEMRSANAAVATASTVGMVLLYGVGGIGIGLLLLLRERYVLWRQPLRWGAFVALLQVLAILNQWPLVWMSYDTALSVRAFVFQQLAFALAAFPALTGLFGLSFMAAESLTRRAFGHEPQLWRLWSVDAARSYPILGQTVAGFLLVGLFFAYEVGLYFFSTRALGWWTPSEALFHPDVLAVYVPWFSAIANSLQAGMWEECLFRAVPLAGAALIGDRVGRRREAIAVAMIVQALVFGAGHATYPTQPSYARAVELVLPSFMFGFLYLRFGLLVAIVLHFAFDVVWFALPLFVSTAPGIRVQQVMVIAVTLVPVWIVLVARARGGGWQELPFELRNAAWIPAPAPAPPVEVRRTIAPIGFDRRARVAAIAAGALGLVLWLGASAFRGQAPTVQPPREDAIAIARRALSERGVALGGNWRLLARVEGAPDQQHRFVRETAGPDRLRGLLGSYLTLPYWVVRAATFEGSVSDRAEEWRVGVRADGAVGGVRHVLPEERPGPTLTEEAARQLALAELRRRYELEPGHVVEVAARADKLTARTDWELTFRDATVPALPRGEPRIAVTIAGDEVAGARRFIFIPEEWIREQRAKQTANLVMLVLVGAVFGSFYIAGVVGGVIAWSRHRFSVRLFLIVYLAMAAVGIADAVNGWPLQEFAFSTAQPYRLQATITAVLAVVFAIVAPAFQGLVAGVSPRWAAGVGLARRDVLAVGLALGLLAAGIASLGVWMQGERLLDWPDPSPAGTVVPMLAGALAPVSGFLSGAIFLLLALSLVEKKTDGWTRRTRFYAVALFMLGALLSVQGDAQDFLRWGPYALLSGAIFLAAYLLIVRHDVALVVPAVAIAIGLSALREGALRAYPGAMAAAVIAVTLVAAAAWLLLREFDRARTVALRSGG
jgi:hypothetical protein